MRQYLLIFNLLLCICGLGQTHSWLNYTNKDEIVTLAIENDKVWIGTLHSGILVRDTSGAFIAEYTRPDGLCDNYIEDIAIDKQGNKWIGTRYGGISKFDGINWTTYNSNNSGLMPGEVFSITIDNQGNKWFGVARAVNMFDGINWTTYTASNSGLTSYETSAIAIDSIGNKWFGSFGGGITKFDGTNWTTYTTSNSGLNSNHIRTITVDPTGNLWIGCENGLTKFDGTTWTSYDASSALTNYWFCVWDIAVDDYGNKWLARNQGVTKFDEVTCTEYVSNTAYAIKIDHAGNIWSGHWYKGASKFNGISWTYYADSSIHLPSNEVHHLTMDQGGNKWMAVGSKGIIKFNGANWEKYTTLNSGLPSNSVSEIEIDSQNNKWIGTSNGLCKYDGFNWTIYNTSNSGLIDNSIRCIAIDQQGNKWIGTQNGVSKFDGANWVSYNSIMSGLISPEVYCIIIDNYGYIWIGTKQGISVFDGLNWVSYTKDNSGLLNNEVHDIIIDKQNNKWIIYRYDTNLGISKFNGVQWESYHSGNSGLASDHVSRLGVDKFNRKWIGTSEGVSVFENSSWTTYNYLNSQITLGDIYDIYIDSDGNKWFCTWGGISVFLDPDEPISANKSFIRGKIYQDINMNSQKDSSEPYLANQEVILLPDSIYAYTNNDGEYLSVADTGKTYKVAYTNANFWFATSIDSSSFILHDSDKIMAAIGIAAPDTTIISNNLTLLSNRCNGITPLWFTYSNNGTSVDSGIVILTVDTSINVYNSFPPYDSISAKKIYFHFDELPVGSAQQIRVNLQMPDFTHMGDTLLYTGSIIASGNSIFTDTLKKILTCAYDPNSKEISPMGYSINNYILKSEELDFTIHFQNTGNDTAYNITIKDTLSPHLDWSTFKLSGSSHIVNTTLNNNGVLNFSFYNIMLPDSNQNELLSHGFVSYKIKCKQSTPYGTIVNNTGHIYFDYNPAIVTNSTSNTVFSGLIYVPNSVSICQGDSIFLYGTYQTSAGIYTDTINLTSTVSQVNQTTLVINTLPNVSLHLNIADTLCITDGKKYISGQSPPGGVYSGDGIITSGPMAGYFDPQAAGIGSHIITYTYTDLNGCSNSALDSVYISTCVGINKAVINSKTRISPNPTSEFVNIQLDNDIKDGQITIYDILGNTIEVLKIQRAKLSIDFSGLVRGMYFIEIQSSFGKNVYRLIKN